MNIAVRYYSRSGHTEQIARYIAEAVGVDAKPITDPLTQDVDLLFLGGAPYAFHLAKEIREFIQGLNAAAVKSVAVFSTSGSPLGASKLIAKQCEGAGLHVLEPEFHCRDRLVGSAEEKEKAQSFARDALALAERSS